MPRLYLLVLQLFLKMNTARIAFVLAALLLCVSVHAWTHGNAGVIPAPAVACNITTGNCTGIGGGFSLFTAATCNGTADDAPAFTSFNTWAVTTWQASHTGLIELDIPSGKICEFISGNVNNNHVAQGILQFQLVGYGATLADASGTGGGFFLGTGSQSGIQFNGTASTVRLATASAGSSSITLLDTSKCGLWSAGNAALISGIDPQGFGDPPNPSIFEWVTVSSTASCAGSGAITLTVPLLHSYKSTWPLYNAGNPGNSDQGGPATLYALGNPTAWAATHLYAGISIDQQSVQTNAIGMNMTLRDMSVPNTDGFCVIPSQNKNFTVINGTFHNCDAEFDKIISNATFQNVDYRQIKIQQASPLESWTCIDCAINNSLQGTPGPTTFVRGNVASLQIGAISYGVSGSFSATNTVISAFSIGGSGLNEIDTRGVWASGNFTVPQNLSVSSFANNGSGLIRLTVPSTGGWSTGIVGDGCGGTFPVTVIDGTHVDLQGSTFSSGVCNGTSAFGSLPLTWAVPSANVYLTRQYGPLGLMLQVADLAVGANNSTVVSFNQNGSPYAGGFPTLPGTGSPTIAAHPAPSWSCVGCTGTQTVTDLASPSASGLPYGSYASRVVTAANSNTVAMPVFGLLIEEDITVTAACSGASNFGLEQTYFYQTVGSGTISQSWNATVNAQTPSTTPRKIFPTTSSGGQGGDSLTTPGVNAWFVSGQTIPFYSNVGNCGSAATTFTVQTNQGVVYP